MSQNLEYTSFLESFFDQIHQVGLDITGLPLDQIASQASIVNLSVFDPSN